MNLDELQAIRETERSKNSLQSLRSTFYEDAAAYIEDLRQQRAAAAASSDDPFDDPDIQRLSDRISTAEQTVEAIYERRVGKLVKRASFAAADMPTADEELTEEERELYTDLVERIRANRESVLDVIAGEGAATGPATTAAGREGPPERGSNPDGGEEELVGSDAESESEEDTEIPRTTVKITGDVGEIVGIDDRTYDLAPDDIVTLPEPNATPLLDRDVASRLD